VHRSVLAASRPTRDQISLGGMVVELMTPSGLILRRDAVALGYDDKYLRRMVIAGQITRIRQGAYAGAEVWRGLDDRGKHLLLSEAVMAQYGDDVALSHGSSVLKLEGPDYGLDLSNVHITHFDGGGRRSAKVIHHEGRCGVLDITRRDGHWLTSPARTVLDVAIEYGLEVGVVVADDFIHRKLTSTAELRQLYEALKDWPGALILRLVIDLATGKSESVGESLGWLLCRKQRLPRPEQQFEVFHPDGRLAGRTDWAWPEYGVLGEFDGLGKYHRFRRPGETIEQAVIREKQREDLLRELTGWRVIRLIWADLFRPVLTAERIRRVLLRAA
jgi:Transcriptional regulator, AbiEi antitoxin